MRTLILPLLAVIAAALLWRRRTCADHRTPPTGAQS